VPRRKRKSAGLTWDQLDGDNIFDQRQRATIDLCIALLETASLRDRSKQLAMLDYVAGFVMYEVFGSQPAQLEWAVTNHGNHLLNLADAIDEMCRG
jgi:predicted NACHT family NTPase